MVTGKLEITSKYVVIVGLDDVLIEDCRADVVCIVSVKLVVIIILVVCDVIESVILVDCWLTVVDTYIVWLVVDVEDGYAAVVVTVVELDDDVFVVIVEVVVVIAVNLVVVDVVFAKVDVAGTISIRFMKYNNPNKN